MTDPEREALTRLALAADPTPGADPAIDWIRRQLEIDARRRTARGPYYGAHGYWASSRSRT